MHRHQPIIAGGLKCTRRSHQPAGQQRADERHRRIRESQLKTDAHGEQSPNQQEEKARKEILQRNRFVVFRPDILPEET